jgi:F0F1-type ATP synthase delta subunit
MSVEVKEEILGGLQIMVGDKFVDLSVRSRISVLSKDLETAEI